jgi:hypothetical protein
VTQGTASEDNSGSLGADETFSGALKRQPCPLPPPPLQDLDFLPVSASGAKHVNPARQRWVPNPHRASPGGPTGRRTSTALATSHRPPTVRLATRIEPFDEPGLPGRGQCHTAKGRTFFRIYRSEAKTIEEEAGG